MTEAWENEGVRVPHPHGNKVLAREDLVGRGSDDQHCSVAPLDGHHYVSVSVNAAPLLWVEVCSRCGRVNNAALRDALDVTHVCATCEQTFPDAATVNAHVVQEHRGLDQFTLRQLLNELRTRAEGNQGKPGSGWLADRVDDTFSDFTDEYLDARREWP